MNDEKDPRYDSEKSALAMRRTIAALEKNTHKFIREHSEMAKKVENLKYDNFMEQRFNCRSGQSDPRFQTSSVGQELRKTLSNLEKTTHNFVREHGELANRAEYLKYTDYVRQHEKNKK